MFGEQRLNYFTEERQSLVLSPVLYKTRLLLIAKLRRLIMNYVNDSPPLSITQSISSIVVPIKCLKKRRVHSSLFFNLHNSNPTSLQHKHDYFTVE